MSSPIADSALSFTGSIPQMYDDILGPAYFEPYAVEMAKRVAALNPKNVLETACGTGRVTNHLHQMLPKGTSLAATDVSFDMLEIAMKKIFDVRKKDAPPGSVFLTTEDAMNLSVASSSFDVVVCQFGAMFFSDKKKAFKEARRVLKPGGTFIFSVWDKLELNTVASAGRKVLKDFFEGNPPKNLGMAFSMNDKNEIAELLKESGFSAIHFVTVTKDCIAESAEALSKATVDGSLISNFVREKDPEAVPVLRNKVYESIKEKFGDHPVRGTMQAIFVTAKLKDTA